MLPVLASSSRAPQMRDMPALYHCIRAHHAKQLGWQCSRASDSSMHPPSQTYLVLMFLSSAIR